MTNILLDETAEQQEIEREADDIAAQITRILVQAFKDKEQRDPTPDEVDMLLSELTEERVAEMLGETFVPKNDTGEVEYESEDGDDHEEDKEDSDNDVEEEAEVQQIVVIEEREVLKEVNSENERPVEENSENTPKRQKVDNTCSS